MDIYYINLDKQAERRAHIEALFTHPGIRLIRIRAIDGTCLRGRQYPAKAKIGSFPAHHTILSQYEIACVLSHRKAWRTFLKSGREHALIVEDDIYIGNDFFNIVTDQSLISTNFDIIKLETVFAKVLISNKNQVEIRGRSIKKLKSYHHGAGGYLINRKAAKELLRLSSGAPDGVDNIIFNMRKIQHASIKPLSIGQLCPAVIVQHSMQPINANNNALDSYIGDRRGTRKGRSPITLSKFRRELMRPFFELNFKLNSVSVHFK